jgi:hypothetical protein
LRETGKEPEKMHNYFPFGSGKARVRMIPTANGECCLQM